MDSSHSSFTDFVFGKDVFLKTEYPVAVDSNDAYLIPEEHAKYFGQPLSFICDFHSGEALAKELLSERPGRTKLLDLGTGTGSVPLTMRKSGMQSLGLDGLDVGKKGVVKPHMIAAVSGQHHVEDYAWAVAPEIVDCCDITKPFRIEDKQADQVKFDYIISTDCFEHLVTDRVPQLVDNIYDHLADDGWGIFEVSTGLFMHLHQTVKPIEWWKEMFLRRFVIDEERSARDFLYVRSKSEGGQLKYLSTGDIDGFKILFWCRKR